MYIPSFTEITLVGMVSMVWASWLSTDQPRVKWLFLPIISVSLFAVLGGAYAATLQAAQDPSYYTVGRTSVFGTLLMFVLIYGALVAFTIRRPQPAAETPE